MSQIAPDGRYVVTTINDPGPPLSVFERKRNPRDLVSNYYVANFKDYRFLQVFYPTRGVLAWYSREAGRLQTLAGADDPAYVHTSAVWSPDGQYLVFARARAQDAYAGGARPAERANDANETQVRYDLYRIPFNEGRGGRAEAVAGASDNGMSNSFPKVSPDGRWMVFSSRIWSPYTKMFLTHIDEQGNDSPAILIENSTAANRAVNLPEFVNVPRGGFEKIDAPVTDYYRRIDVAEGQMSKRQFEAAAAEFGKALAQHPDEPMLHNSIGVALARAGRAGEAERHYRQAISISADYPDPHSNLGAVLLAQGRLNEAIDELEKAVRLNPDYREAYANLGAALAQQGRFDPAIASLRKAVEFGPADANARRNLALALALLLAGRAGEAVPQAEEAARLAAGRDSAMLDLLGAVYAEAVRATRQALEAVVLRKDAEFAQELGKKLASLQAAAAPGR